MRLFIFIRNLLFPGKYFLSFKYRGMSLLYVFILFEFVWDINRFPPVIFVFRGFNMSLIIICLSTFIFLVLVNIFLKINKRNQNKLILEIIKDNNVPDYLKIDVMRIFNEND